MSDHEPLKTIPIFNTDEEAAAFLDQDLSEYDLSQFKPMRFEFETKDARVNMRLPQTLLDAVKKAAQSRGIPYQRYVRQVLEEAVQGKG